MAQSESSNFNLEQAIQELEAVVERMEQGDLPLEESLQQFQRGVELTRACQKALKQAEQRVQILMDQNGDQELAPFADADRDDSGNA